MAEVVDASNPERRRTAKVTRMTGELDPRTRTMQIEVNIDNSEGFLVPGSFAYVTLHIPIKSYPQIPVSGLIVRGNRQFRRRRRQRRAALQADPRRVDRRHRGHRRRRSQPDERIAINLPDEVSNGSRVQPVARGR